MGNYIFQERFIIKTGVFLRDHWVGMDVVESTLKRKEIKTICVICKPMDVTKRYNTLQFAEHLLAHVEAKEVSY